MALTLFILGCNDKHDIYGPLTTEEELDFKLDSANIPDAYSVNFDYSYSSSGGDRSWDVNYEIVDNEFTACTGEYKFSGQGEEKIEPCTLEMLNSNKATDMIIPKMNGMVAKAKLAFKEDKEVLKLITTDRHCYYIQNMDGRTTDVVCFNAEHEIVTYLAKGGYGMAEMIWLLNNYELTDEVEDLMG